MKRYLFDRILGIILAGILMIESSIPVFATEIATEIPQIQTVQETESEETTEIEIVEETLNEETAVLHSSEEKSMEVSSSESRETEESKIEESAKVEETSLVIESNTAEMSTETEESFTEDSSTEDFSTEERTVEESFVEEGETSESISEEETIESEDITEEETETTIEEETETETEAETEALSEALLFALQAPSTAPTTAPAGVNVVDRTATTAAIIWGTIDGYTEYEVHRSTNASTGFALLEAVKTNSNLGAFLDTSCESGKVYYYKVRTIVTSDRGVEYGPFSEVVNNSVALQQIMLSESKLEMHKGEESILTLSYAPNYAAGMYDVSWSSDNTKVATVIDGKIIAVGTGTAKITATAGDKTAICEVIVSSPLEQILLSTDEVNLTRGESATISASLLPEDTTDQVNLAWSSSDENIATVIQDAENGKNAKIVAVSEGTAIISVSAGDMIAKCKVIVSLPITDFELSDYTVQLLESDDSVNVSILVDTSDEVSYVIDNPEIVECELHERVLTVKSCGILGTTQIHITIGGQTVVVNVKVVEERQSEEITSDIIPVTNIALTAVWIKKENREKTNEVPVTLYLGDELYSTATIGAEISPSDATNQQIKWSSSDKSVAVVDENGAVKAVGIGRASIIATANNGISEKITVIVRPGEESYEVKDKNIILYCNEELPEKVSDKGTYSISLPSEMDFEYRSSNVTVATVDANGLITAHNPGNAVISVIGKGNGDVQTIQVTVKRIIESIEVPLDEITVMKGTKPEISFEVFPTDASIDCLNTIMVKTKNGSSKAVKDIVWTKGKTSGTIKFSVEDVAAEGEEIIITAGDTGNRNVIEKSIKVHFNENTNLKVASIKVSGVNKMKSATEQTLGITVKDTGGNELIASDINIGFTSSNPEIATVDQNGTVTALKGGNVTITAHVMNGSNVKVNYAITVEQRPEEIVFDRSVYGVSKAVNKSVTVTVQPRFVPVTTANKNVTWTVTQVMDANGAAVEGAVADYFTVDTKGTVTAKAKATEGMRAVIVCTSKAFTAEEQPVTGTVIVEVQPKKVTAVKFAKTAVEAVGLGEHNLAFSTTFVKEYSDGVYEAFTSDTEIATVKEISNGQVILEAHKYGTVTVTLCADYAITTTCKVTIYPVARGAFVAKEAAYLLQQAQYNGNDRVQLQFVDSKTKKQIVNPELFTYQSSNPNIVYVDENGVAYANAISDGKITANNNQITITATLKDDPDKRKVTAKVIVCTSEQIGHMDVAYYPTTSAAVKDKHNTSGDILSDSGTGMVFNKSGQQFVLRVAAYGVDSERITNPQIMFTTSDASLATIASQTMKSFVDNNNKKYQVWEAVVTVKQAGRFCIDISAKDQKKYSRSINFVAYSAKPILVSNDLGTINRNAEIVMVTDIKGQKESIASDKTFTVLGSDGTEITSVSVDSARVKLKSSNKIEIVPAKKFAVRECGNNEYRLYMLESEMDNVVDGTYTITLNIKRTLLGTEDDASGYVEEPDTTTASLDATFKIASKMPKLSSANITLNTFIKGDAVKIPINTTENIESVTIASGMMLAKELDVFKYGKDWYAKIRDDAFDNWKKTSTSGVLYVKVEGYEVPVSMNLKVICKSTKPIVKQLEIPSIQLQHGVDTYVTLVDGQKQIWGDYTVERKNSKSEEIFKVESQSDNRTKVTFVSPTMKLKSQGVTLSEKVLVSKAEWRSPIEISILVKAYNGSSVPTVGFEKTTININKAANEEVAETKVKISHSNVVLNEGEWTITDNCKYKTVENKKTVWHQASEAFKVEYIGGVVKVSLRDANVPNGTYKLTMTELWDDVYDKELKKPLTTGTLTVVVKNVSPTVTIKMSGELDLVKRSQSTLKGTVTVSNVNSTVKRIRLIESNNDGFDDKFYCTRKDNTFTIYARSNAVLTIAKITGNVEITMSNGQVLFKSITFTPKQSVPSVITPVNKTIYKSATVKTVSFNFNEQLTAGVQIADIKAISVPSGLNVQDSNGRLYVTLGNKSLKQGKYKIVVNVYFKGAQAITGDVQGKAVQKTVYVEVKE